MKAIETQYKGCRFRSRLEARWAVFFDALGLQWQYEPEGFDLPAGRYLPDFFIPSKGARWTIPGLWIEIKGLPPSERELLLARQLADARLQLVFLCSGLPNEPGWLFQPDQPVLRALLKFATPDAVAAAKGARFEHGENGAPMKHSSGYLDEFEALRKKGPQ